MSSSAIVGQELTARLASGISSAGTPPGAITGYPQGSPEISSGSTSMHMPCAWQATGLTLSSLARGSRARGSLLTSRPPAPVA
jgi:hypothetical protein